MWETLEKISHRFARHRKLHRMTLKIILRSGEMYQIYGLDNSELYYADFPRLFFKFQCSFN